MRKTLRFVGLILSLVFMIFFIACSENEQNSTGGSSINGTTTGANNGKKGTSNGNPDSLGNDDSDENNEKTAWLMDSIIYGTQDEQNKHFAEYEWYYYHNKKDYRYKYLEKYEYNRAGVKTGYSTTCNGTAIEQRDSMCSYTYDSDGNLKQDSIKKTEYVITYFEEFLPEAISKTILQKTNNNEILKTYDYEVIENGENKIYKVYDKDNIKNYTLYRFEKDQRTEEAYSNNVFMSKTVWKYYEIPDVYLPNALHTIYTYNASGKLISSYEFKVKKRTENEIIVEYVSRTSGADTEIFTTATYKKYSIPFGNKE